MKDKPFQQFRIAFFMMNDVPGLMEYKSRGGVLHHSLSVGRTHSGKVTVICEPGVLVYVVGGSVRWAGSQCWWGRAGGNINSTGVLLQV